MKSSLLFLPSFLIMVFFTNLLSAQNQLIISNPQDWWSIHTGQIDRATISITPEGVYTEIGLYLTISDQAGYYPAGSQLEIVMDFQLPEGSIVHDSWLWVGNEIIRADILDRWSANQIYEDIVGRRQDPSILFKNDNNSYSLRIYPLISGESRKIKISYLVPSNWTQEKMIASLPIDILKLSNDNIMDVNLLSYEKGGFTNPEISGVDFIPAFDSILGNHFMADISDNYLTVNNITYQSPMKDGVYLNHFEDGNEKFYQLAIYSDVLFDTTKGRKLLVLLDYDQNNTNITKNDVLQHTKSQLIEQLDDVDSFNLMKSGLISASVSDVWLPADENTINKAFDDLKGLNSYSNFINLISNGFQKVHELGKEDAQIILISNADEFGDLGSANSFLDDFEDLVASDVVPFQILNYQNRNYNYISSSNSNYILSSLYISSNMAAISGGEFFTIYSPVDMPDKLSKVLSLAKPAFDFFDFYTQTSTGFCHSRYSNLDNQGNFHLNKPIVEIGKYVGEFPFLVNISGSLNGEVKLKKIEIDAAQSITADTLTREAWFGNYINEKEQIANLNTDITDIIRASMNERVLSKYTAFLCLEPSQGGEPCFDCIDETNIVSTDEPTNSTDSLEVLVGPNPFSTEVNITVKKSEIDINDIVKCQIFGLDGRIVSTPLPNFISNSEVNFEWNGTSDGRTVGAGAYFAIIQIGTIQKHIKLIFQP